ncbi:MAG: GNAT family N-acetyltransferase [Acholeplasmataceae bacterium]|nr:GNAT family N-acetyltransferase [Acholeplasmataceae bacterium]
MLIFKKLNPDLIETYMDFFDCMTYEHAPHWASCYCHFYHANVPPDVWKERTGEQNKRSVVQDIYNGRMTGFMALKKERCIGWANVNDVTRYAKLAKELAPYIQEKKVALSICYVIHPDDRNQGVSRALLDHAISFYRESGYDFMLALPMKAENHHVKHYRGSVNMYLERGYEIIDMKDDIAVMRKML